MSKKNASRFIICVILAATVFTAVSCGKKVSENGSPKASDSPRETPVQTAEQPSDPTSVPTPEPTPENILLTAKGKNDHKLDAFGVEWDPHFWRFYNGDDIGERAVTEEDWQLITERAEKLGIQKIRMMVLPGYYEKENDNDDPFVTNPAGFDFFSQDAVSIMKELDVAEKLGIKVNLTVWGCDYANTSWLAVPGVDGMWLTPPSDCDEYAENISVLLDYVFNVKNYTCVTELTLYNEPDWAFLGAGGVIDFEYYVKMYKTVHDRLVRDGLRDKIKLIASDDTSNEGWLRNCLDRLNDTVDGFNSHCYRFGNGDDYSDAYGWSSGLNSIVDSYSKKKSYTHNEFSTNGVTDAYHASDIDSYDRGVAYAKLMCAFINGGSDGMLSWEFFDQYYDHDQLMTLGLFAFKDSGWKVRPFYHAWGLIMKYTRPGSNIYRLESSDDIVCGTSFKTAEGKWTFVLANCDRNAEHTAAVTPKEKGSHVLNVHLYSEQTVTESDELIASSYSVVSDEDGFFTVTLPANSFVVMTELE